MQHLLLRTQRAYLRSDFGNKRRLPKGAGTWTFFLPAFLSLLLSFIWPEYIYIYIYIGVQGLGVRG